MKAIWGAGALCAAICLAPLGWRTAELWFEPAAPAADPVAVSSSEPADAQADCALVERLDAERLYAGLAMQTPAKTLAWEADRSLPAAVAGDWLAVRDAILDFGQRTPADILRDLAALQQAIGKQAVAGSHPPWTGAATTESDLAAAIDLWRAVEASHTLAQAAQAAFDAADYQNCVDLCREHELQFATRLETADSARFAADASHVRQLNVKSLAAIDTTAADHRALAVEGLAAVTQLVARAPDDLAAQVQTAYDLDRHYADPQVHKALRAWIDAGLNAFLHQRPVPDAGGALETISRASGHIVLGSYEPQGGQAGVYLYRADPHAVAGTPSITVQADRLDGPPRPPLFVVAAQRWNECAGDVAASPASTDGWRRLAAVCEQIEQAASRERRAAAQPGGVVPAQYAPLYQHLSLEREMKQCQVIALECDQLRALLQPGSSQQARR